MIGLHGAAGSGKDTVGEMLYGWGYRRVAYADALRADMLKLGRFIDVGSAGGATLAGLVRDLGWDGAKRHPQVRALLQVYGTEVARDGFGSDCWIERADRAIDEILEQDDLGVVVTDVRFDNEAEHIIERGGLVVQIFRPSAGLDGEAAHHASESGVSARLIGGNLLNGGTLDDLRVSVGRMMRHLRSESHAGHP